MKLSGIQGEPSRMPPSFTTRSFAVQWMIHCFGVVVLGLAIGLNLYFGHERVRKQEERLLNIQTNIVDDILDKSILALNTVLEDLRYNIFPIQNAEDVEHRLGILANALVGVRTLSIYDANGTVVASNRKELLGRNFDQRNYFKGIMQGGDPNLLYISSPFKSVLGTWVVVAGRMITGPGGEFAGIVNASLDPDFFTPLLGAVLYAPDMWAALAHADGTIFLMVPQHDNVEGRSLAKPGSFFTKHMQSGSDSNVFYGRISFTGEDRMLAVRTIRPSGVHINVPLIIGISRDDKVIYENWRQNAWIQGGALLLVAVFSTLALYIFQKRQRESETVTAIATEELARRDHFLHVVMDNVPAMVAYWNNNYRCEYANKVYCEWFGKTWEEMRGIELRELLGETLFAENEAHIHASLQGAPQVFEQKRVRGDGSIGHTLVRYVPDRSEEGIRGMFVLVSDVTELVLTRLELEQHVVELHNLATIDALTGVSNRRHFLEQITAEFSRARRYGICLVLFMIDVDKFKVINDTYGHDIGDEVLQSLGAALKAMVRTSDFVGRLGGEEFAALLIEIDVAGARCVAERLLQALSNTCIDTRIGPISYTVSIGMATYFGEDEPVDEILRRADLALYQAKHQGRNRVCCHGEY